MRGDKNAEKGMEDCQQRKGRDRILFKPHVLVVALVAVLSACVPLPAVLIALVPLIASSLIVLNVKNFSCALTAYNVHLVGTRGGAGPQSGHNDPKVGFNFARDN